MFGPLERVLRPLLKSCSSPISDKPTLSTVTTEASAACHHMQVHCAWVLSALPRRRVTWYFGCIARRPSPLRGTAPVDHPQLRALDGRLLHHHFGVTLHYCFPCPTPFAVTQYRASSACGFGHADSRLEHASLFPIVCVHLYFTLTATSVPSQAVPKPPVSAVAMAGGTISFDSLW